MGQHMRFIYKYIYIYMYGKITYAELCCCITVSIVSQNLIRHGILNTGSMCVRSEHKLVSPHASIPAHGVIETLFLSSQFLWNWKQDTCTANAPKTSSFVYASTIQHAYVRHWLRSCFQFGTCSNYVIMVIGNSHRTYTGKCHVMDTTLSCGSCRVKQRVLDSTYAYTYGPYILTRLTRFGYTCACVRVCQFAMHFSSIVIKMQGSISLATPVGMKRITFWNNLTDLC